MNPPRLLFRRRHRLAHDREFALVFAAKASVQRGPLRIHSRPSGLPVPRLGLSVGRRVGGAAARVRIKRLLREAFRLEQARLPAGLDLVITVNPHAPAHLDVYRHALVDAAAALAKVWARRTAPAPTSPAAPPPGPPGGSA